MTCQQHKTKQSNFGVIANTNNYLQKKVANINYSNKYLRKQHYFPLSIEPSTHVFITYEKNLNNHQKKCENHGILHEHNKVDFFTAKQAMKKLYDTDFLHDKNIIAYH